MCRPPFKNYTFIHMKAKSIGLFSPLMHPLKQEFYYKTITAALPSGSLSTLTETPFKK